MVTAPLFDRVLTHHLALTLKAATPIIAAAWFSLIWAGKLHATSSLLGRPLIDYGNSCDMSVRENNTGALFAIFIIIGIFGVTILPVSLELGSEVTRNAETSASILWLMGNLMPFIFILGEFKI